MSNPFNGRGEWVAGVVLVAMVLILAVRSQQLIREVLRPADARAVPTAADVHHGLPQMDLVAVADSVLNEAKASRDPFTYPSRPRRAAQPAPDRVPSRSPRPVRARCCFLAPAVSPAALPSTRVR